VRESEVSASEVQKPEQVLAMSAGQCKVDEQLSFPFEEIEFVLTEGPPTDWQAVMDSWRDR